MAPIGNQKCLTKIVQYPPKDNSSEIKDFNVREGRIDYNLKEGITRFAISEDKEV